MSVVNGSHLARTLARYQEASQGSTSKVLQQKLDGTLKVKTTVFKLAANQIVDRQRASSNLASSIDLFAESNGLTNEQTKLLKNAIQPGFSKTSTLKAGSINAFMSRIEASTTSHSSLDDQLLEFVDHLTEAQEPQIMRDMVNRAIAREPMDKAQLKTFVQQTTENVKAIRKLDIVIAFPEQFSTEVIYRLASGDDCSDLKLDFDLPKDGRELEKNDHLQYVELQEQIAECIQREDNRPTIEIDIKGSKATDKSLGIVGGTGPLSDATMLKLTFEKLSVGNHFDLQNVHIRLLSSPPPRGEPRRGGGSIPYAAKTAAFAHKNHSALALASNTAHENIGKLKTASSATHLSSKPFVKDMVAGVVAQVNKTPNANPLVLGTSQAYLSELYPKRFTETDTASCTIPKGQEAWQIQSDPRDEIEALKAVDSLNHITLQAFIDFAKSHGTKDEFKRDLKEKLSSLIKAEVRRLAQEGNQPTHVILGCTELPLALGHDGIPELEQSLKEEGIETQFIDTEEFFANTYAELAGLPVRRDDEALTAVLNRRLESKPMQHRELAEFKHSCQVEVQGLRAIDTVDRRPDIFTSELLFSMVGGEDCSHVNLTFRPYPGQSDIDLEGDIRRINLAIERAQPDPDLRPTITAG